MGTKANDLLIGHYLDAARFMLFAGEIRDLFPRIKALDQRLLALYRFAHVLILIRGQNETNDPWPSRQASQPLAVSAQAR